MASNHKTDGSRSQQGSIVELRNVSKAYPSPAGKIPVLDDFNFRLPQGALFTIFGPNGSGKTTIINLLAGVLSPDSGTVCSNSNNATDFRTGYVFQNYSDTLHPWRSVRGNVALPLEFRRVPAKERSELVDQKLAQFDLMEHAEKYVYQLSGGLKQLVAICQATVYDPQVLLLDEPFSSIDYSLARRLWLRFRKFQLEQQVSTVFVSHNIDEAAFLGDRVFVLSPRPTSIVAEIVVPFGKERPLSLLSSREFFSVTRQVLDAFEQGKPD